MNEPTLKRSKVRRGPVLAPDVALATARQRIPTNAVTALDLSIPGLTTLPDELLTPQHTQALSSLDLSGTDIADFSSLCKLRKLRTIDLSHTDFSDISNLDGLLNLRRINLSNTLVTELPATSTIQGLIELDLSNTKVSTVASLAPSKRLRQLSLQNVRGVDFSALGQVQTLTRLFLTGTDVVDIAFIRDLRSLNNIGLSNTDVSDIEPVSALRNLKYLHLNATKINDVEPIVHLKSLRRLYASRTPLSNAKPLSALSTLNDLNLSRTNIENIEFLSDLRNLIFLNIAYTGISSVAVLANLKNLTYLDISSTNVSDLAPIATMTALIRDVPTIAGRQATSSPINWAAKFGGRQREPFGFHYAGCGATGAPPFAVYSLLSQPACTLETINHLRREKGLLEYWPLDYERPANLDEQLAASQVDGGESGQPSDILAPASQHPATYTFSLSVDGLIEPSTPRGQTTHPDIAQVVHEELRGKAIAAEERMRASQAPKRVVETIRRLTIALGLTTDALSPGRLLMAYSALESDVSAYDSFDGRKELPEDALAELLDLANSTTLLMGCFPQFAEINAERVALRVQDADVAAIRREMALIRDIAKEAHDIISNSSVSALSADDDAILAQLEIIEASGSRQDQRAAAIRAVAKLVGQKLLDTSNFVNSVLSTAISGSKPYVANASHELYGFLADSWREVRSHVPRSVGKSASTVADWSIRIAALAVAIKLGAPLYAIAAVVPSIISSWRKANQIESAIEAAERADDKRQPPVKARKRGKKADRSK